MAQTGHYCYQCQQMRLFRTEDMGHTPHILASIFLCGLWLPIWAIIAASYDPPWLCAFCGSPMMVMQPVKQAPQHPLSITEPPVPPSIQRHERKKSGITSIFDE